MASLTDLFNPSFFIILGIVVLFIALTVVYFESKMREQNHKIASMLSLVSTMAEDMVNIKMAIGSQGEIGLAGGNFNEPIPTRSVELIEVSDDDDSETDDDNEPDDDPDTNNYQDIRFINDSDTEDNNDDDSQVDIDDNTCSETNDINDINDSIDEGDIDDENVDTNSEVSTNDPIKVVKLDIDMNAEPVDINVDMDMDMENLEESNGQPIHTEIDANNNIKEVSMHLEDIDFKKLPVHKLRNVVVEKGLINNLEAQKLKKPDLLKLLEVE